MQTVERKNVSACHLLRVVAHHGQPRAYLLFRYIGVDLAPAVAIVFNRVVVRYAHVRATMSWEHCSLNFWECGQVA